MQLAIHLRTCARVDALHSPRRIGANKREIILRSLASLCASIETALAAGAWTRVTLAIVDDHSDIATFDAMGKLIAARPFPAHITSLTDTTGNGASMRAVFAQGRASDAPAQYFIEDDYLHAPEALTEMAGAATQATAALGREVSLFPCDFLDRYRDPYPSLIFLGRTRYWRSVQHTTASFLVPRALLDRRWADFTALAGYDLATGVNEDTTINRVWRDEPCFAPMPSLTVHLHDPAEFSPFVPWQDWWRQAGELLAARGLAGA